jgi:hypothetical protein
VDPKEVIERFFAEFQPPIAHPALLADMFFKHLAANNIELCPGWDNSGVSSGC